MNLTGIVVKKIGFGKTSNSLRDFRETKNHFIDANGNKFSKKTGNSSSGYKYKGVFIGETLDLGSIKPKIVDEEISIVGDK
jgi:hypothetical protein